MCFEFEYLYWAKLEEEARQRNEEAQRQAGAESGQASPNAAPPREATPA